MMLGSLVVLFAFNMETTVYSSGTFVAGSYVGGGSTYNLGLLQQQMMIFQSGLAAFVAGSFFFGGARQGTESLAAAGEKRRHDARNEETDEERYDRLEGVRRLHKIIAGVLVALIAAVVLFIQLAADPLDSEGYLNVDDNLAAPDIMNVDENLTTDDINAL